MEINMEQDLKDFLILKSKQESASEAEIVRRAIREYRSLRPLEKIIKE